MSTTDAAPVRRATAKGAATKQALLDAALEVVAEVGVRGVTHRRVAAVAGVALGVTNYHYRSIDDLLLDAFRSWVAVMSGRWETGLGSARTVDDMVAAALAVVHALHDDRRDRILLYEFYAQSVRDERYRVLVSEWSRSTRAVIERKYAPRIAQQLEAAWEGLMVQLVMGGAIDTADDGADLLRLVLEQSLQPRDGVPGSRGVS